jgi:hypothetical protein
MTMTLEEIESEMSPGDTAPADAHGPGPAGTPVAASQSNTVSASSRRRRPEWLGVEEIAFIALLLLAIGGMAVTDYSARSGLSYWLVVIPLFAAVSIFSGWRRASADGKNVGAVLLSQLLHWGALVLAVYLIYLLERTGRLNREDAGLVALLSLSLTTVLAGIHFDRRLAVLGILLAIGTASAALVEEFFWILLIPTVLAGVVIVWRWRKRGGSSS